jgi:hypothetical protein
MERRTTRNTVGEIKQGGQQAARRAMRSQWMERVMRLGFFVRGLVYGLVGLLALEVALGGRNGKITEQQGAIATIGAQPFGRLLLVLILVGLAGYALWGIFRAWMDPLHRGSDAKGIVQRIGYLISAISYGVLMIPTYRAIQHKPGAAQAGGTTSSTQRLVGSLLTKSWGPWVVGLAGLAILFAGLGQIATGLKAKFEMTFDPYRLTAYQREWATRLGRIGYVARGIVFAIMGILLIQAARLSDPMKARGIDGALMTLARQPNGQFLLVIIAAGLVAFGAYSILGAFWFRFKRI